MVTAEVRWPGENSTQRAGVHGHVKICQKDAQSLTKFSVCMSGLKPRHLHGFHIHTNPVTSWADLNTSCASCGGHFNPTNQEHGSVFNHYPRLRHVGDLINNIRSDGFGRARVDFWDDMACLIPTRDKPYTIIGKSLVIHQGTDDLGRQGRSPNLPYVDSKNIIYHGTDESEVEAYSDEETRELSLQTGNAGARLACGNILPLEC